MNELSSIIGDPKVEAVLSRLQGEANGQMQQLLFHYLPKLSGLLLGRGMNLKWDQSALDFYKDKYIPIDPAQGKLLCLLARSLNAQMIVEFGISFILIGC